MPYLNEAKNLTQVDWKLSALNFIAHMSSSLARGKHHLIDSNLVREKNRSVRKHCDKSAIDVLELKISQLQASCRVRTLP